MSLPTTPTGDCVVFHGVTYLGCATVNAPRSEVEIYRNMAILNEQSHGAMPIVLSVPANADGTVRLVYVLCFEPIQLPKCENKMNVVVLYTCSNSLFKGVSYSCKKASLYPYFELSIKLFLNMIQCLKQTITMSYLTVCRILL